MVDYGQCFRKPFTDVKKFLIGVILSLIPIVNLFAKGYILQASGVGKHKGHKKMPEWKDWGDLFLTGLVAFIIGVIYMIPAGIVFITGAGMAMMSLANAYLGGVIPPELLSQAATNEAAAGAMGQLIQQNWALALPAIIQMVPILLFAAVLGILARYLIPIAVLQYISTGKFSEAFSLKTIFKKAFTGEYFVVWLVAVVAGGILGFILGLVPIVGFGLSYFVVGTIVYSLYGQVYEQQKKKK